MAGRESRKNSNYSASAVLSLITGGADICLHWLLNTFFLVLPDLVFVQCRKCSVCVYINTWGSFQIVTSRIIRIDFHLINLYCPFILPDVV